MSHNIQWINIIRRMLKKSHVNKMLKTAKKMFTTTSFGSGGGGALNSKFEAQNKAVQTLKGIRWEG
jgi:hypothetical protein